VSRPGGEQAVAAGREQPRGGWGAQAWEVLPGEIRSGLGPAGEDRSVVREERVVLRREMVEEQLREDVVRPVDWEHRVLMEVGCRRRACRV